MNIELFGNRNTSVIFEIYNQYELHFNPASSTTIEEDYQQFYLGLYDLTDVTQDFFVLEENNDIFGIAGLLRSSYFSNTWFIMFATAVNGLLILRL